MKKWFVALVALIPVWSLAQSSFSFRYDQRPPISINGRSLPNSWAGGLNAPQFSTMRLNDDSREDLVVFDRTSGKVSTFLADGLGWHYAPEYEILFPTLINWMLLVDFDGDGRKDLFTHGVQVYRNVANKGSFSWQKVADPLQHLGFNDRVQGLYVAASDIPAITDFDEDGDIDLIAFDVDGDKAVYYKNLSREKQPNGPLTLDLKRVGLCWGGFSKEYCNEFTFGQDCQTTGGRVKTPNSGAKVLHSGNTLSLVDTDGDGHKDLLFGFVSCTNIARLINTGPNNEGATYTGFDKDFPARNPINFQTFPATFLEDVDGDGLKDLLAAPNNYDNNGQLIDFRASAWFYKNGGTNQKPDYQLVQKDFLQADMLDLGEGAAPALGDLDGDGDLDLLVGYSGIRDAKGYHAGLWQFENTGTANSPAFTLVSTDYLNLSQTLTLTDVIPAFADVDANGSTDLVITATGTKGAELRVILNAASRGMVPQYGLATAKLLPAPTGFSPGDRPTFWDVDRDGIPDLLIGKTLGSVEYHRNAGTATAPTYQLQNQEYGGIKLNLDQRSKSVVVADLNADGKPELLTAGYYGQLALYRLPDQPNQSAVLLDSLPGVGLAGNNLIATLADLDGDALPDLLLGTGAGGLRYLKNTSQKAVVTAVTDEPTSPWAYPNPTERFITVRPPHAGQLDLYSAAGQVVRPTEQLTTDQEMTLDLVDLPDGVYLLRLTTGGQPTKTQKVVLWK